MQYDLETGESQGRCYLRIAKQHDADAAAAALSRLSLYDRSLRSTKLELEKASPIDFHFLTAGWLPSSTSDLASRVVRPPRAEPNELLAPLLSKHWIRFTHLETLYPHLRRKIKRADARDVYFDVARNFYAALHRFDVVGMTVPYRKRGTPQGWRCKMLFGNSSDAREAAALWRKLHVVKNKGLAHIFRGGPDIHKKLLDYQQSLPKDVSEEETRTLMEVKYKEVRIASEHAPGQRIPRHRHPNLAIGQPVPKPRIPKLAVGDQVDAATVV